MRWADVSFTDRTVRQFAGLSLIVFGGLALWQGLVHGNLLAAILLSALALTLGPLGLIRPGWIRPVYWVWMAAVFPIGWAISHLVLAVLYFGLFMPLALVFRLRGRDALQRRFQPELASYWQEREQSEVPRYFRQY